MIASLSVVLHFHASIPYKFTLLIFSLPAALWIVCEIRAGLARGSIGWLEAAGAWSFSLYLCHKFVIEGIDQNAALIHRFAESITLVWGMTLVLGVSISLCFYYLVEAPSHWLARTTARRLPQWPAVQ